MIPNKFSRIATTCTLYIHHAINVKFTYMCAKSEQLAYACIVVLSTLHFLIFHRVFEAIRKALNQIYQQTQKVKKVIFLVNCFCLRTYVYFWHAMYDM